MIENLLKIRIEECYNTNKPLQNLLNRKFQDKYKDIIMIELNDFILSNNDVYESNNLLQLIYESFLKLDKSRFTNFIRNLTNNHPNRNRTYSHMISDIKENLNIEYNLPETYYNMTKNDLNKECDKLFLEGKYLLLSNTRKFIKDNFKVGDYQSFVFENRDLAKKILKRNYLDETNRSYIRLRMLLNNNPGYLGLFTYYNKEENISVARLQRLYKKILSMSDILTQLSEPIVSYMPKNGLFRGPYKTKDGRSYNSHFERLEDDLLRLEEIHNAKLFANEYPGGLKRALANNDDFIEIIRVLSTNPEKLELYKKFWLKKVSRYKTIEELIVSLNNFVYADNDIENIRKKINNDSDLKVVFDDGELIVIRVLSFDSIQNIGGDTSWCIKDSLSYWTEYVTGNNVQLVIMDYTLSKSNPERKIGLTLYGDGRFMTAHNIYDGYMTLDSVNNNLEKHQVSIHDLFSVAKNLGSNQYYNEDEIKSDNYGW